VHLRQASWVEARWLEDYVDACCSQQVCNASLEVLLVSFQMCCKMQLLVLGQNDGRKLFFPAAPNHGCCADHETPRDRFVELLLSRIVFV